MVIAKRSLKKLRAMLLEITPEITAILDDVTAVNAMRAKSGEVTDEEATKRGVEVLKEFLDLFLVRQYDAVVRVMACLYSMTPEEIEEKEAGEIKDMIFTGILQDDLLVSFFPRLRLLAPKTP